MKKPPRLMYAQEKKIGGENRVEKKKNAIGSRERRENQVKEK